MRRAVAGLLVILARCSPSDDVCPPPEARSQPIVTGRYRDGELGITCEVDRAASRLVVSWRSGVPEAEYAEVWEIHEASEVGICPGANEALNLVLLSVTRDGLDEIDAGHGEVGSSARAVAYVPKSLTIYFERKEEVHARLVE